jgi:cation diffusion facilitator CzcD-associated flavoprotein CzcO
VQYYKSFADHYNIPECTQFDQNVEDATWDEEQSEWVVRSKDATTNEVSIWRAKVLIQAAGTYNRKSIPAIPGISTFKGDTWHTLDWPSNYDFTGKIVAYVGTGPTSVQVLPHLQSQAASVNVFCRSMTYCHPFSNFRYPKAVKWAFRWIPGLLAGYTYLVASLFGIWAWFAFRPASFVARFTERYCLRKLDQEVADPVLRRKLAPSGRFGAKRPLVSLAGFFDVLQKENVHLQDQPIVAIDAAGVITKDRSSQDGSSVPRDETKNAETTAIEAGTTHIKADVLIWGTGFKMQGWGGAVPTLGRGGVLLTEHWSEGPDTLYGAYPLVIPASDFTK